MNFMSLDSMTVMSGSINHNRTAGHVSKEKHVGAQVEKAAVGSVKNMTGEPFILHRSLNITCLPDTRGQCQCLAGVQYGWHIRFSLIV